MNRKNQDLFPEIIIFPTIDRIGKVAKGIGHIIKSFVTAPHLLSPVSDHSFGGGPTLDRAIYEGYKSAYANYDDGATPATFDKLPPESTQLMLDYGTLEAPTGFPYG